MYKTNPIQFFMIVAIIYLLLKQSNVIENLKPSQVTGEINLQALSTVSQLAQKIDKAFSIDTDGNVTFKEKVNILPRGTIVAWNEETAPAGWALCDGQNGTPDLRGRFIRMQNNHGGNQTEHWKYQEADLVSADRNKDSIGVSIPNKKTWMREHAFNDRGGTDVMQLDTRQMPRHTHTFDIEGGFRMEDGSDYSVMKAGDRLHKRTTDPTGGHPDQQVGECWGHNNIPPYHVLSYIMKL